MSRESIVFQRGAQGDQGPGIEDGRLNLAREGVLSAAVGARDASDPRDPHENR